MKTYIIEIDDDRFVTSRYTFRAVRFSIIMQIAKMLTLHGRYSQLRIINADGTLAYRDYQTGL